MGVAELNIVVSVVTLLLVGAASVAALIQLRHLSASNDLEGLLEILREWQDPAFQGSYRAAIANIAARQGDPAFLDELRAVDVDRTKHPELGICDWYEMLGAYLKYRLIREDVFLDVASDTIGRAWEVCQPTIDVMRETRGDRFYENFEFIAVRSAQFRKRHPDGSYPAGFPRMEAFERERSAGKLS